MFLPETECYLYLHSKSPRTRYHHTYFIYTRYNTTIGIETQSYISKFNLSTTIYCTYTYFIWHQRFNSDTSIALGTCCKRHGYPVRNESVINSFIAQLAQLHTGVFYSSRNGNLGLRSKPNCMPSNNIFKVDCSRVCSYTIVLKEREKCQLKLGIPLHS